MSILFIGLVQRSALLRASRRTATSEVARCPSFETPCFARLLRMRFAGLSTRCDLIDFTKSRP